MTVVPKTSPHPVLTWLRQHKLFTAFSLLYAVAAVVLLLMPFQAGIFVFQSALRFAATTVLGLVMFVPMLLIDPAEADQVIPYHSMPGLAHLALVTLIIALGILVAFFIERRWQRGNWWAKTSLVLLLVFSSIVGFGYAAWKLGNLPVAGSTCEASLAGDASLRITTYQRDNDQHYWFFFVSRDGGQHWSQFMDFTYDRPTSDCSTVGLYDDQFFWVWTKNMLAFTVDAGQNWQVWAPAAEELPRYVDAEYARIEDVVFESAQAGTMWLRPTRWWTQDHVILRTQDGGLTWQVDEDASPEAPA